MRNEGPLSYRSCQEILNYLHYMEDFWSRIVQYNRQAMQRIDEATVEALELTAPGVCKQDAENIHNKLESGEIFGNFTAQEREAIWNELRVFDGLVPTFASFCQNGYLLEAWSDCMKRLFPPCSNETVSEAMDQCFCDKNQTADACVVQDTESAFSVRSGDLNDRVDLGKRQLWLFAMRHYRDMPREPTKKGQKRRLKKCATELDDSVLREFAALADGLGFESDEIKRLKGLPSDARIAHDVLLQARKPERYHYDDEQLQSHVAHIVGMFETARPLQLDRTRPPFVSGSMENGPKRCGFPYESETDDEFLFLDNVHAVPQEQGPGITCFFVLRSIYLAFLGQRAIPPRGAELEIAEPMETTAPTIPMLEGSSQAGLHTQLADRSREWDREKGGLLGQIQQLTAEVAKLDLEKGRLLDQGREQDMKITALETDKSQLKDQYEDVTSQLQKEQRCHRHTEDVRTATEDQLRIQTQKALDLGRDKGQLREQYEDLVRKLEKKQKKEKDSEMAQNATRVQLRNQLEKVSGLESEKQQLKDQCENLARQLQEAKEELTVMTQNNLKEKEAQYQERVRLLNQETAKYNNVVKEREDLAHQSRDLLQQRAEQGDYINQLESGRQQLKQQYEDLSDQLQEKQKEYSNMEIVQLGTGGQLREQTKKISKIETEKQQLKHQLDNLARRLGEEREKAIEEIQSGTAIQLENQAQRVTELERESRQLEEKCHQLQASLSQAQRDCDRLSQEREELDQEKLELLEQGRREYGQLLAEKESLNQEMINMRDQANKQYDQLVAEKEDVERQIMAMTATAKAERDEIMTEKALLCQENEDLLKRQGELQYLITELERNDEQLKVQYKDLNNQLQEAQDEREHLKTVQIGTGKRLNDQTRKVSQLEHEKQLWQKEKDELAKEYRSLSEKEKKTVKKGLEDIKQKLLRREEKITRLESEMEAKSNEVGRLQQAIAQLEQTGQRENMVGNRKRLSLVERLPLNVGDS
jgi:hypothetical protein